MVDAPPLRDPGRQAPAPVPVRHLYVHAPFCARRCFYCDFAVTVNRHGGWEAWVGALERELALLEGAAGHGATDAVEGPAADAAGAAAAAAAAGASSWAVLAPRLDTLFVGGGTPSLLGAGAMAALRDLLGAGRLAHDDLEWTAEANPESLTPEVARAWREAGLNRLSLGVQSFQAPVLRWMGRLHGAQGARDAVHAAREAGIGNLSVDLIFGLPPSLERDWRADLETVLALEVPHVSLYGLTVEEGTPLARQVAEGRIRMPDDDRYEAEYLEAHEILTGAGFRHYEVSNFARPGFESRHNRAYWNGSPYLGLGNAAHSFLPPVRRWNLRDWADYLQAVDEGRVPLAEAETPGPAARELERLWLGLRTDGGLDLATLQAGDRDRIRTRWIPRGLAREDGGRVRLTARGWLLLDDLAVELSGAAGPDAPPAGVPAPG